MNALQKLANLTLHKSGNKQQVTYLRNALEGIARKTLTDKKAKAAGIDKVTILKFMEDPDTNLKRIAIQVSKGTYRFSKLKAHFVEKPNKPGVYRMICVPTLQDRIVQKALQNFLSEPDALGLKNGVSYGFIKGEGVQSAVRKAQALRDANPYAYKTDIETFFDTLPRKELKDKISSRVKEKSLHGLLHLAVDCEVEQIVGANRRLQFKSTKIKAGNGVRQGMPLSPLFSNLILEDFDKAVIKNGIKMVRYADDLIIFAKSYDDCLKTHEFCKVELAKLGLKVPEVGEKGKTEIFKPEQTAHFLGLGLKQKANKRYEIVITDEQIASMKAEIVSYSKVQRVIDKENLTITGYFKRLENMRRGYFAAYGDCSNRTTVMIQVGQWIQTTKKLLYKNFLNIDTAKLTKPQLQFLEIVDQKIGQSTPENKE